MFKVGDKVRRISGANETTPIGFEGVIRGVLSDEQGDHEYRFADGAWGYADWNGAKWELVSAAPIGPVVTETVTKTRIVPGVYDGVAISGVVGDPAREVYVCVSGYLSADRLDAAAAVLSALAKGLRDA